MQDIYRRIALRQYWIPLVDVTRLQTTLLSSPPDPQPCQIRGHIHNYIDCLRVRHLFIWMRSMLLRTWAINRVVFNISLGGAGHFWIGVCPQMWNQTILNYFNSPPHTINIYWLNTHDKLLFSRWLYHDNCSNYNYLFYLLICLLLPIHLNVVSSCSWIIQ